MSYMDGRRPYELCMDYSAIQHVIQEFLPTPVIHIPIHRHFDACQCLEAFGNADVAIRTHIDEVFPLGINAEAFEF